MTLPANKPLDLLTIPETAQCLRVSVRTVFRLIQDGELKPVRIRGCTRLAASELAHVVDRASGGKD